MNLSCQAARHLGRERHLELATAGAGRGQCGCRSLRPLEEGGNVLQLKEPAAAEDWGKEGKLGTNSGIFGPRPTQASRSGVRPRQELRTQYRETRERAGATGQRSALLEFS